MSDTGRSRERRRGRVALRQSVLFAKARRHPGAPGHADDRLVDSETNMIVRADHVLRQAFGLDPGDDQRHLQQGLS